MVLLNVLFFDGGDEPHQWAGYAVAVLVGLRWAWGLIGPAPARLRAILPTLPRLKAGLAERTHVWRGHNPLGALMALALWVLSLALAFTGWLMGTDAWWGDESLESLHKTLSNVLLICAVLHVAAVVAVSVRARINLPLAMLTGCKTRRANSLPFRD